MIDGGAVGINAGCHHFNHIAIFLCFTNLYRYVLIIYRQPQLGLFIHITITMYDMDGFKLAQNAVNILLAFKAIVISC